MCPARSVAYISDPLINRHHSAILTFCVSRILSLKTVLPTIGSSNLAPFMAIIAMRKERANAQCECGGTEEPAEQVPHIRQRRRRSGDPRPSSPGSQTSSVFGGRCRRSGTPAGCRGKAASPQGAPRCKGTLEDSNGERCRE